MFDILTLLYYTKKSVSYILAFISRIKFAPKIVSGETRATKVSEK